MTRGHATRPAEPAMDLLTVKQAAGALGISPPRLRVLLGQGRVQGAQRVGRDWVIPAAGLDAVRRRPEGWPKGRSRNRLKEQP